MDEGIGEFLRSRRARIRPEEAGVMLDGARRRVSGLRREETAALAGLSVDYYVRLEQGRARHVSESVLDAVARALRLSPTEREHLGNLAHPSRLASGAGADRAYAARDAGARADPVLWRLLDVVPDVPAMVLGRTMDLHAWNPLADLVFGVAELGPRERNMARLAFLDPDVRGRYLNWPDLAAGAVGFRHLQSGRHPGDPMIEALIAELSGASADFRRLWSRHDVRERTTMQVVVDHPRLGGLQFTNVWLTLPAQPDGILVVYLPEPGVTVERLRAGALIRSADTPARPEPPA